MENFARLRRGSAVLYIGMMCEGNARMSALSAERCSKQSSRPIANSNALNSFPGQNVLKRLSAKQNRRCQKHKMRSVDAVISNLVMTHPIRIRGAMNMVSHGASRWINGVRAKVRCVPFECCADFLVRAGTGVI